MELAASMNIASFGENGETPVQHSSLEHRRATRYISTCKTIHESTENDDTEAMFDVEPTMSSSKQVEPSI
jgi:hypothetical protein